MAETSIEWTATRLPDGSTVPGYTFNVVWGCSKVSPECAHCYAETFAKRTGHQVWGPRGRRRFLTPGYYLKPFKWNAEAERSGVRRKVFCSSMADFAEDHPDVAAARPWLWELVARTPWLDWLLLTKRPGNLERVLPESWLRWGCPPNVWLGTTLGVRRYKERRLSELLAIKADIHFLSCEPLLEDLGDLSPWLDGIDWVIVGSESGPRRRPMSLMWTASIRDQCAQAGVAFFTKQISNERDPKGGKPEFWPPGPWPREMPEQRFIRALFDPADPLRQLDPFGRQRVERVIKTGDTPGEWEASEGDVVRDLERGTERR